MPIKTLKELWEFKHSESSVLKARIVENEKKETFLDIRKYVNTEKYTGPTKSGMWIPFEVLNDLIEADVLKKARDYMEDKATPKPRKKNPKKAKK